MKTFRLISKVTISVSTVIHRGRVSMGLNGMWNLITPTDIFQCSPVELFSFNPIRDPRRLPPPSRLKELMGKAVKAMDFETAIHLRDQLKARGVI